MAFSRGPAGHGARTKGKDERMVRYIKEHFFARYREFESLAHLNQLAEQWLREEADRRLHGTVKEVVAERFARELPHLQALPTTRFDTAYRERRVVAWDGYIEVRGNRYSVPGELCRALVDVLIGLVGGLAICNAQGLRLAQDRTYVEFAENETEIRLDEEWRSVLVLRSATVLSRRS